MSYDFRQLAAQCHDKTWEYYPEQKRGYCSDDALDVPIGRFGWLPLAEVQEAGHYDTVEGWEHEEYAIDWDGDGFLEDFCRIAKYQGEPIVVELDWAKSATVCVDYNDECIYPDEISSYYSTERYIINPDGTVVPYEGEVV